MRDIMALKSIGIDLFKNVMAEARHNQDLLDSYSPNQFKSKENIIQHIDSLKLSNPKIVILGSWYGSILIPAFVDTAALISCIDINGEVIGVAKNRLFSNYKNIDFITSDAFDPSRDRRIKEADLIINTSCEHMNPMDELIYLRQSNAYFAFQSNNMFDIPTHTNCVHTIEQFEKQLPPNADVLIRDEVEEERGTRFTLVGKLCAE